MMKRIILILIVLLLIPVAQASTNLLSNGDFEEETSPHQFDQGTTGWPIDWQGWGSNYGGWIHADAGFYEGTFGATLYLNGIGLVQPAPVAEGETVIMNGVMARPSVDPYGALLNEYRFGILKMEFWSGPDPTGTILAEKEIGRLSSSDPADTIIQYSGGMTAPADTAEVRILAFIYDDEAGTSEGKVYFDSIEALVADANEASGQIPYYGEVVPTTRDLLSWVKPAPSAGGPVECEVWIDTDPNLADGTLVLAQADASSALLSSVPYALSGGDYYWRVDCYDPNGVGTYKKTEGQIWYFQANDDTAPVVTMPADEYVWLDGGSAVINLTAGVDDDGDSTVDYEWTLLSSETDPATIVSIVPDDAKAAVVTIDNTGWFQFQFTATDDVSSDSGTVYVGVYADACEAAIEDPAYEVLAGDTDGDCDVDIVDFANVAKGWMQCMSKEPCDP